MRILLATAALAATTMLACATQSSGPTGPGGSSGMGGSAGSLITTASGGTGGGGAAGGGSGGTGGTGASSTTSDGGTSTTTTSTSTETSDCGNGVKNMDEQCDQQDFGGKTCESLGFNGGFLQCNGFCAIVASGCTPPETCNNGQDDDQDGLTDCIDSDCSQQPVCLDSCASPVPAGLPYFNSHDTTGRPAVQSASCSPASGSELVFQLTAPANTDMTVTVWTFDIADFTVSVRTSCADQASELHCENEFGPGDFGQEQFVVSLIQGQTYYVIVDGTSVSDFGFFDIFLEVPQPEFDCENHFDDDFDGYLDCDDATECQQFTCSPGNQDPGSQCFSTSDCAVSAGPNDPICLNEQEGFPNGYCSEFCDLANPVCAGDAICADSLAVLGNQISKNGICLDTCLSAADCRPSYDCVDRGLGQNVCVLAPESTCDDFQDNDLDGTIDCQDQDCKANITCNGGAKGVGQPCTSTGECFSNNSDPICFTQGGFGAQDGYCSQFCNLSPDDCGITAICTDGVVGIKGAVCLDFCNNINDCRPGYSCQDFGLPKKVCVF